MRRLTKETADLRTELAGLKAGLASGRGERGDSLEAGQVMGSLQEQREAIAELRAMIEFQVRPRVWSGKATVTARNS